jgi:DNA topoisomerase-6 subunit B
VGKRSASKEKRSGRKRRSATPAGAPRARKKAAAAETLPLFDRPDAGDAPAQAAPARTNEKGNAEASPAPQRGRGAARARPRAFQTAQTIAQRQREISVSEFFAKNRHLLGFDSPSRAILTAVKEAVDNSLDACEEAGILPDLLVEISELSETRYRVVVEDSGPGIVKAQVPKIFGKLLYGSKFHQLKQSRGQQGIGISAAVMYAQLTTGKAVKVTTRISPRQRAHLYELQIDTKKNMPVVLDDGEVDWDRPHGTRVDMEIEATYKKGRYSVDAHIHQTALANPHADIRFMPPKGDPIHYKRLTAEMPAEPVAIKPHPHGVELGVLLDMMQATKARSLAAFFASEFSRMSAKTTQDVLQKAGIAPRTSPKRVTRDQAEKLIAAFAGAKIMKPPTNCLSAVGEELLVKSLEREFPAAFYSAVTRPPAVYRGNPFQIEAALAYGVEGMPADELVELYRFANRAPLVYQQSACAITRAVVSTAWRNYGLNQSKGALPTGAMVVMVQIESVWVPFTSESKEAIAHYPEIIKEIKLALQECGRQLARFIRKGERAREEEKKRSYIEQYIPHIGIALQEILGLSEKEEGRIVTRLKDTLEKSRKA